MADILESLLKKLAYFQMKYSVFVIIFMLLATGFLAVGLTKISIESDIDKGMPQDLPIFKITDKINDKFGNQDAVLVVVKLDENSVDKDSPVDIRDPRVINFLVKLEENLKKEDLVENIQSVGSIFNQIGKPNSLEESKLILSHIPNSGEFFNKDYSATIMIISADLGSGQEKVKELNNIIKENIEYSQKPKGIKTMITGTPPMRVMVLDLLVHDAIFTLLIAAIIIFILLLLMERSFTKSLLIFLPLLLGITWTLGVMGWLSIKLSIATVGIGAMILGLGVEYGVFIVTRYKEERKIKSQLESLQTAVSGVGSSIIGSGSTTIVGFLALTLSIMPMLRDLGITLALGIGFSLFIAVFINPSLIIAEENFERWVTQKRHEKHSKKLRKHKNKKWD